MGLQPCGTDAAYQRHRRAGEPACDACKAAHVARVGEYKRRVTAPIEHGTTSGFLKEVRRGLKHCEACTHAFSDKMSVTTKGVYLLRHGIIIDRAGERRLVG